MHLGCTGGITRRPFRLLTGCSSTRQPRPAEWRADPNLPSPAGSFRDLERRRCCTEFGRAGRPAAVDGTRDAGRGRTAGATPSTWGAGTRVVELDQPGGRGCSSRKRRSICLAPGAKWAWVPGIGRRGPTTNLRWGGSLPVVCRTGFHDWRRARQRLVTRKGGRAGRRRLRGAGTFGDLEALAGVRGSFQEIARS